MKSVIAFALILLAQPGWSYTVSGNIYTTNGSQSDVQAACSAAPDNGTVTVVIPNGSYTWTGTLTITKSLTLSGQSANGVTITDQNNSGDMIDATSSANGHINIYWLNFAFPVVAPNAVPFSLDRTEPSKYTVMVHDCAFDSHFSGSFLYPILCRANGVIFWNDTFTGDGVDAQNFQGGSIGGIQFVCGKYGYTSSWNTPDTFGANDTTGLTNSYVEDCTFNDALGSSNMDDNSRVVWRYNKMNNSSLGSHGQETSVFGARHWEIYNNTFIFSTSGTGPSGATYPLNINTWYNVRGGTGVITNNAMDDIPYGKTGVMLNVYSITRGMNDGAGGTFCPVAYPAPHQTGWGWSSTSNASWGIGDDTNPSRLVGGASPGTFAPDGTGATLDPIYVWNNTGTETSDPAYVGTETYLPDNCSNGQVISTYLQRNRDYYVNVAKPNWTPYTHPHPLHAQYALSGSSTTPTPNATPLAPQNLRVVN
jgi:hypothetical protein